ncbi:MAG: GNAT family N-acetyltransferase, partial [Lachnospiraceae bacterium]|nr:GNAT family N-acetyltransferase [Lachnospiraceae bacterium]
MKIVTARKEDLGLIRKISHETIKSVYPAYYPAGAVAFFLAHHSEEHIAADIADGKVWILYDEGNPVGTITTSGSNIN